MATFSGKSLIKAVGFMVNGQRSTVGGGMVYGGGLMDKGGLIMVYCLWIIAHGRRLT